jgi:hypothetical protein
MSVIIYSYRDVLVCVQTTCAVCGRDSRYSSTSIPQIAGIVVLAFHFKKEMIHSLDVSLCSAGH